MDIARSLCGLGNTITADSEPNYDSWGPDSYWTCGDWVVWHKALKAKYGKEEAAIRFKQAWDKLDPFEHATTQCRYDSTTVNYLLNEGIDIRSFLSAILLPIFGAAANIADGTEDASVGVNKTVNTLKALLPIAVVGLVGAGGYYVYKNYLKDKK